MPQAISSQAGLAVWFTGLSGAGKTTLCQALEPALRSIGYRVHVLDADSIRQHLNSDLGFTKADRDENVHRIGSMAQFLVLQDVIVLVAAISPAARKLSREVGASAGNAAIPIAKWTAAAAAEASAGLRLPSCRCLSITFSLFVRIGIRGRSTAAIL